MLNPLPKFQVEIDDKGEIQWSARQKDRWNQYKKSLMPGIYDIVIQKHSDWQSDQQRKYYWGCVIAFIMQAQGANYKDPVEKEKTSDDLRDMFAPIDYSSGEIHVLGTSEMNMREYSKYIDDLIRWAKDFLNCEIPNPDDVDFTGFLKVHHRIKE